LKFADREFDLRMNPRRFADPAPGVDQARERLNDLRPVLLLDTKSERLLRAMADLARQYDTHLIALRRWQGLTEATTAAIKTGPGMPAATGRQEAFQQAQKRGDSLARSVQEVIESAREALAASEQPIARLDCLQRGSQADCGLQPFCMKRHCNKRLDCLHCPYRRPL